MSEQSMSEQPLPERPMMRCRIPQSWQTELEAIASQTGQSPEQIIYEAIAQYLGSAPARTISTVQNRLESVEQRIDQADEALLQTLALTTRVAVLEQKLAHLSNTQPYVQPYVQPLELPLLVEDDEDEPDEIMESFRESEGFQDRVRQATAPSKARIHDTPMTYEEIEDEPDEILYDFIDP